MRPLPDGRSGRLGPRGLARAMAIAWALWLAAGHGRADPGEAVAAARPAPGGVALLAEAERAPTTVVGTVRGPVRLDDLAWIATLEVEIAVRGAAAPGERIQIAWDERSSQRPRRFDDGTRILVALEPLPGWSIWRTRLGEREAVGVARRGDAFLRDPDPQTVARVGAWLALGPGERSGAKGVNALLAIAWDAQAPLPVSALELLDRMADLDAALDMRGVTAWGKLIVDPHFSATLRSRAAELAGRHRIVRLAPAIRDAMRPGSAIAAPAVDALGLIEGGLGEPEVGALLQRPEPEVRAMAVRRASPGIDPDPAWSLARSDPSPLVRSEAVMALGRRHGMSAFEPLAGALDDADPRVRGAAASALGELGEPAVARLVERIREADLDGARDAMVAMARAGPAGRSALAGIASSHPDEAVRSFARFLLGRPGRPH